MAWTGSNDTIGVNSYKNYMYGNKIFILDEITSDNCAYLIGDLTAYVLDEQNFGKSLSIIINSPGGCLNTLMSIIGLLNIAKLHDITIFTFVLGLAGSAASMLATQGDERYISKTSQHFIHFGCFKDYTRKYSEIKKIYEQNTNYAETMLNLYLEASDGKLTRSTLLQIEADERGYLTAEECVKYGLCDIIIEDDLHEKRAAEKEGLELEDEFKDFLKKRKKQILLEKKSIKIKQNNTSNKSKSKKTKK